MRFGVREICDVSLKAKNKMLLGSRTFYKNEPVLYFDSLKTSMLEGASTTVYATGGRGNARLVSWEGERTVTFTMEDALISPESFAILTGAGLVDASKTMPAYVHVTSRIQVQKAKEFIIEEVACAKGLKIPNLGTAPSDDNRYPANCEIFFMKLVDGEVSGEPHTPTVNDTAAQSGVIYGKIADGTFTDGADDGKATATKIKCDQLNVGDVVLVDYYVRRIGNTQTINITPESFGGNFYLEASTLFRRDKDGVDMPAEFVIPNCKIQSNFTFSMASSGDPSTFSFVMDAFPDYTKFDPTKKVFASIQVITDTSEEEGEESRTPCTVGE